MEELHSTRQKVVDLVGKVNDVEDAVVRAERLYNGKCYAMAYVDLSDNVVGRASELGDFQERILGDDFFGAPGNLRWNKYLYIVAGPKSLGHAGFEKAKAAIESDKEYARKRVVSEQELETLLGAGLGFGPSELGNEFNVVAEWEKRLASAELDELLDRPTRRDVVERIGTRSAKRVPVADRNLTLDIEDTQLSQKRLASLSIDNFRSVHDGKSYTFGQVNLIVGPNGTGKTSLLEAIEYFYCGHNRRPGTAGTPKISGTLAGNSIPLTASVESRRIRARCFSWYNREERLAKSILGAFTRYNFLDTDAAFRLSTELEPSAIPEDLSRLLVGADASTIWDYLSKISPEVETAYIRANGRVEEDRRALALAQKELEDLSSRPSNGKALTEAFRAALDTLGWLAPRCTTNLVTPGEANGLPEVLGHIQGILAAGPAAVCLDAILERARKLDVALALAHPLDIDRSRYVQEAKRLPEQALANERASQSLERWLTYVNSGFSATRTRVASAKTAVSSALVRLGIYATGGMPELPAEYASVSLESALRDADLNVRTATVQVADLESLSANFGKAASARAEAARELREAAHASFVAGHPKDECPICRKKYSPQELAFLVEQITDALEQPSELVEVAAKLAAARSRLKSHQELMRALNSIEHVRQTINLPPNAECAAILSRLTELREELAKADVELRTADKDWQQLTNSGLTTEEHEVLSGVVSKLLNASEAKLSAEAIEEARTNLLNAAAEIREDEAKNLELLNRVTAQLAEISTAASVEGWNTRAPENGGMPSLVIMQEEIASVQRRATVLQGLITVDGRASLAELSMGVIGASRLHSEASQAVNIENSMSESIATLTTRIDGLSRQLLQTSAQANNYKAANDTLKLLLNECSLERATQESLDVIGTQINDIFGRIHAPNEYEYIGNGEAFLQTSATQEKRTLEQVSTGQRAAFALSVFLALNRNASAAPPVILIDDPIAHIDDLNALSFLDYLRDLVVNSNRQVFFATADTRIAALFTRKFGFLGESFKTISLDR